MINDMDPQVAHGFMFFFVSTKANQQSGNLIRHVSGQF
jgi:hypothetical protein